MDSESYLRSLGDASGDWGRAVRDFAGWYGSRAADVLAREEGVSRRTAERWIARATNKINPRTGKASQSSEPKPMQQVGIVQAVKNHRAAQAMRNARQVAVGDVQVQYENRDEGSRRIGSLPIAGALADAVNAAADLVASGDYARAGEVLDAGVLDAYGVPEGTLEITDYPPGFALE